MSERPLPSAPGDPAPPPSTLVICGKGAIATAALSYAVHYLAAQGFQTDVVAAPNRDDRGCDTWEPSLIRAAAALGVPCVDVAAFERERGLLLISLEYDRIVRVGRFASRRLYNIHFSALPKYRGVYTSIWPILNGDSSVGVTLHYMDAGIDTGPCVARRTAPLPEYLTARQLYDVFLNEGLALFREWLPALISTCPAAVEQDEREASTHTRASLDLRRVDVDLSKDAETICRFVRAFSFPEYQLPTLDGRRVRSCVRVPGTSGKPPGTPLHATAYSASFSVGNGEIVEVIWA